jgi:hypothetical protein
LKQREVTNLMRDLEFLAWPQECRHDSVLGMCMHATAGLAHVERIPEERSAGRFLQVQCWTPEENPVTSRMREGKDEDVLRLDPLFLYSRGCN